MSDNNNKQSECIKRLLVCGGIYAVASCLPGIVPAGAIATLGVLSADGLSAISGAIASVIAGNTANALDNVVSGKEPEPNLLANEDLTKAVGRAIAAIITLVAEDKTNGYNRRTRRHLLDIAKEAKDNWVEIARRKISEADYQELREYRLDEFLTAEGESFTRETALTPEIWLDLFAVLNMAAKAGGGFQLERSVHETVAQQLYVSFPKALRQALKEDFNKDGKAFAGLMLSLLTGIKKEVATLKLTEAELVAVNGRLGEIIDRLNAGEEEQQAFFTEIADNIDSGFAEVCRRFDVIETNITDLLAGLDEKIEKMANQIDDLHQTLHRPPLTRQEWRELCRQMLKQQREVTTNIITNNRGVSPIINDVYVPLALVERREEAPQVKAESPEGKETEEQKEEETEKQKETEEKLVPVSEDEFLREVLRLGQSKSGGKRIAVVGEPGSGKTTRLQFIADWILREDLGLPVWVSLADLEGRNVSSYLESAWLPMLPGVEISLKELKQQAQEVWLLLDGADEMTARIESRHVDSLLGGWASQVRVIVTCRTNVWEADRNAFAGFDVFRNLEFEPAQVEAYIRKWFGAVGEPAVGEKLWAELGQTPNQRLRDLIGNPLRLWMLCQIWQPKVGLPKTQAQLYGEFVDWVYHWRVDREIADSREEIDGALAKLALAAMQEREESSRLRLREKWVREQLQEPWIFEAVKRLGWLNVVSREGREAVYGFYHLTFLEYFAALAVPGWGFFLSHVPGKPERGVYRIFAPEWKQVILLWLGRDDVDVGKKEVFVLELVGFEDGEWNLESVDRGFYEYRAYFLAAAGINEFRGCSLAEEIVEKIVRWGFGYFDEEKQEWVKYLSSIEEGAREILKETIRDRAITALEKLLATSTDEFIRWLAAESLGQIASGNEKAITALEELLATSTNNYTRSRAAESLGQIAPEKGTTVLVELLATSTDKDTRRQAAKCLGEIAPGNEKAITALAELLGTTADKDTRWLAAKCLGKIAPGKEKAITALGELLATSTDEDTRWLAARCLGEIAPGNEKAITALVELLGTTADKDTRRQAAKCLGEIAPGNEKAITALEELLTDEYIRYDAANSLGQIAPGNEKAITALMELLATSTDKDTRSRAATCLGQIAPGNEKAITALVELLGTTTDEYTRWLAAYSLKEIPPGNEKAITALVELLATSTDKDTRSRAATCLWKVRPGNEKAITALAGLLATTTDEYTRWLAAKSLEIIGPGNEKAITALVELLATTTDEYTRRKAAESLGKIAPGNEKAITALLELLATTTDECTRREAAESLGKIAPGNEKAITALEELLATSTDDDTRRLATYTLKKIAPGNEKAITALDELLATSTDEDTRRQAAYSLLEIVPGNEKAITALEELLATSTDDDTRRQAAYSLLEIVPGNEKAITALEELLATSTDDDTSYLAAWSLGQIAPGNEKAITALVELLATTTDERTRELAAYSLQTILKTNEQYCQVVSKLKHCVSNETYQNNFKLFKQSHSLIWQCAQNLPYPEFYRAWHGHNPDRANQTPQTFDPQQLNRALQQRQLGHTVQPYYIDGSQFVNPDNPAPEIYDQMLDQNSPQRTQGEPANMQQFKLYWKQQCRQGKPILILYEDPQPPAPQGFSETFLLALSRCGGSICLVWEGETPSGLPTFSPADPDLIEKLVEWMEECGET